MKSTKQILDFLRSDDIQLDRMIKRSKRFVKSGIVVEMPVAELVFLLERLHELEKEKPCNGWHVTVLGGRV